MVGGGGGLGGGSVGEVMRGILWGESRGCHWVRDAGHLNREVELMGEDDGRRVEKLGV